MQKTNRHRTYQREEQSTDRDDGSWARRESLTSTTVLVIAGISTSAVKRGLTRAAALSSANGITLNVFDNLADLPHYSETAENQRLPRPVAALRDAAIEAHAALVVTHYYGRIPATVHNAIDWLTRRSNYSALHDKPLAVIGPTEDGYCGVPGDGVGSGVESFAGQCCAHLEDQLDGGLRQSCRTVVWPS